MTKALTDLQIQKFKAGETSKRFSDGEGLYVQVGTTGSKLFRLAYRFGGKQKTLALGVYPTVSLRDARKARDAAKAKLELGIDPGAERKLRKVRIVEVQSDDNTFQAVAERWFTRKAPTLAAGYGDRIWTRMLSDIFPEIGHIPIAQIEPPVLLAALRKIEDRGAIVLTKRVKGYCGQVFRFGIAEGLVQRDPSAYLGDALKKAAPEQHRAALRLSDLPQFIGHLDRYEGDVMTKLAVQFVMLTFVRTGEIRFAEWIEFEGLKEGEPIWRIPKERMKMGKPHIVPLAPQAVVLLDQIRALNPDSPYLFPETTKTGVISENRMIYALYRMGYHSRATIHGFRGTASTILNETDLFKSDWIEMQLAHVQGAVRGAYNAAQWLPARRKMMCWYADLIDEQRSISDLL